MRAIEKIAKFEYVHVCKLNSEFLNKMLSIKRKVKLTIVPEKKKTIKIFTYLLFIKMPL